MRSGLKCVTAAAVLVVCEPLSAADSDRISVGDYLFVQAHVIGCGNRIRTIDAGQVTEGGGFITLGDIELEAAGKTIAEVTVQLVDAWESRTGQKSKTIQIMRVPAADPATATMLMLQLYQERRKGCSVPPWDWQNIFQLAKPYFAPGIRNLRECAAVQRTNPSTSSIQKI